VAAATPREEQERRLTRRIGQLKQERRAVILAHLYQPPAIQDLADFVGDSLGLSRRAAATDAEVIVFCGVHFMAESAAILSPDRPVLLPEPDAGCPMADMVDPDDLRARKAELPGVPVVCYVNSSAEVKAESDICCTSRNAVEVVESLGADQIIFVPDRNLGHYVSTKTDVEVLLWDGYCSSHDAITAAEVRRAKQRHPEAEILVHPECRPTVVALADHVLSTSGMLRQAHASSATEFIVCTEMGILYQLERQNPGKRFYLPSEHKQYCANMKKTNLFKLASALENLEPRVTVPEDIRLRAVASLERMLAVASPVVR